MPEPVERVTRGRVVTVLRVGESVCAYAAASIGNGLGHAEVRSAAADVAADLEVIASRLRALARLDPGAAARRAAALELAATGMSREAIAARLGVTPETARRYLRSC
jgi:DNA-binding NarL/FixJ family response regulator